MGLLTPGLPLQIDSIELQNKIVPSDFPREIVVFPSCTQSFRVHGYNMTQSHGILTQLMKPFSGNKINL